MRSFSGVVVSSAVLAAVVLVSGCGGEPPEVLLRSGITKLKNGDVRSAASQLEKAAAQLPSDPSLLYHLGVAYMKAGNAEKAVNCLKKAAELAPNDPAPLEVLAQVELGAGKLKEAREYLATADQITPGIPRILNAMGVVEIKAGDGKKAFSCLIAAREKDSAYAPTYYNLGVLYRDIGNNREQAAKFFRQYLQTDPNGSHAAAAREFLQPRPDKKPSPADSYLKKARDAIKNEDYAVAIENFKGAVSKDPANPDAVWELAAVYEKISSPAKAVECYQLFSKQFRNDQRATTAARKAEELGGGARKKDRTDAGASPVPRPDDTAKIEQPAMIDPASITRAKDAFTEAFKRQGEDDLDGAIAFYKRACQLDGTYSDAFFNMGLVYRQKGDIEQAKSAFSSAVSLKPKSAQFRYMLALSYRDLKNHEKAIKELNQVLRIQPDYADAYLILGLIYKEENRPDTAKGYFDHYQEFKKSKP